MSVEREVWPATAWQLSAPESAVLVNGVGVPGRESFKLALMELLSRGVLRLTEVRERARLFGTRRTKVLTDGSRPGQPRQAVLARVWSLYHAQPAKVFPDGTHGVELSDFLRAARQRDGGVQRFTTSVVIPALVERGLLERQEKRLLLIFKETRHEPTAAGLAAQAALQRWMLVARRDLNSWTQSDPSKALAFSALAGAALLLMPDLLPDLQLLDQQLKMRQPAHPGLADSDGDESEIEGGDVDLTSFDSGGLDLSGLAFDFDALGDLDSAFDAIDSAVDSGDGGGDGGDGGGGDGGGGDGGGGD